MLVTTMLWLMIKFLAPNNSEVMATDTEVTGADAYGGGGNVEDEFGGVDEEEEGSSRWSH